MYAVIEDSGTQIKVAEGDVIQIDVRDLEDDAASLTFDKVMLVGDEEDKDATQIGTPFLKGASVTADIVGETSEKVTVTKFKRRKNYRRIKGHRQPYLQVRITDIKAG
ncbi:MAG: 50S ribosomal protein L21 [Phycisphaeraceae bacterium]|nr:50S ribosomal protein L21 [Phycisphaeraceae bacterium]